MLELAINLKGDCVIAVCPAIAPYPIGCDIVMAGGDPRGCVASQPALSIVFFKEGNLCGSGHLSGTLTCSSAPGAPLGPDNCPINKPINLYPPAPAESEANRSPIPGQADHEFQGKPITDSK